jgi:Uma2 family endonuclease
MSVAVKPAEALRDSYAGLRMAAEEFFRLPEDERRYELVDGVVILSPSPTPKHQSVSGEIYRQLANYLIDHPIGKAFLETDAYFDKGPTGGDLVYRADVVFVRADRVQDMEDRLEGPPDLVVEVVSPDSRRFDSQTKKEDYRRCGVLEYWLVDPRRQKVTFYRLRSGRYVAIAPGRDTFASQAVPGFVLDLALLRQTFKPWRARRRR